MIKNNIDIATVPREAILSPRLVIVDCGVSTSICSYVDHLENAV